MSMYNPVTTTTDAPARQRTPWTLSDDGVIMSNYSLCSKQSIMSMLPGRSWGSVTKRASELSVVREKGANFARIGYFDTWSDNMAYVLGFIAADGCIIDRSASTGDRVLSIGLSNKDRGHLIKIQGELCPNKSIWTYTKRLNGKSHEICYLRIGSRYMCNRLEALGIQSRKSLTMAFPSVPIQYMSHFVRGYYDGDGSFVHNSKHDARVNFCSGSRKFLTQMAFIVNDSTGVGVKNVMFGKAAGAYYLNYHSNQAMTVAEWMYRDSALHLDRKYDRYITFNKVH
jgi:hypothetical protein